MVESNEEHVTQEVREVQVENPRDRGYVKQIANVVWFIVGVIVAFLLVRVVLALLGANLENQFANFIYQVTDPLVAGFRGLLQIGEFQAGVSRLELETIVAAVVYGLVGWALYSFVMIFDRR